MKKDFAVIGLGTFGQPLCKALSERGAEVIALDRDEERVNAVADFVSAAYCCDSTKRSAMESLGLQEVDNVVIAIGDRLEAVILTVILLKEIGVKRIIARAEDDSVKRVLLHLGVDEVVDTRALAVSSLCYRLLSRGVTQYFEITKGHSVATIRFAGKEPTPTLEEMNPREKYNLNVLLIHRGKEDIVPGRNDRFEPGDEIVVFGAQSAIRKLDKKIK